MLVCKLERLVDRLWFLEAPVADGIEYDNAQTYLFGNAKTHENSFADKLLTVSPCGEYGFARFKVSVDQLMTCIMQAKETNVPVFGKTFDVKVQFSPLERTITLSDIVFGWEVGQHQEFAVTVVLAAWTACVKRGDCDFLKFSGPSLHIIGKILSVYDTSEFISLALNDASVQSAFIAIKQNVVFRQDIGDSFLLDENHPCFRSGSFAVDFVPAWYASDFANMLYTIHTRISASCREISLRISVICVLLFYDSNSSTFTLDIIDVRPCAQRLGLARCVLWRLIRSCHLTEISKLVVSCAVPATQRLCRTMGFSVGAVSDDCAECEIGSKTMAEFMEPASCGLQSIIPDETTAWPEFYNLKLADSSELNDQSALNKRMQRYRPPTNE